MPEEKDRWTKPAISSFSKRKPNFVTYFEGIILIANPDEVIY
jgi:hypothetical protein